MLDDKFGGKKRHISPMISQIKIVYKLRDLT